MPAGRPCAECWEYGGEPGAPSDPANGLVWRSIVDNIDLPGKETPYVSVVDLPRTLLLTHPWALSGSGAVELKERQALAAEHLANTEMQAAIPQA